MSGLGKEEVGGGCEHDILGEGWYQEFEDLISGHSDILGNVPLPPSPLPQKI